MAPLYVDINLFFIHKIAIYKFNIGLYSNELIGKEDKRVVLLDLNIKSIVNACSDADLYIISPLNNV